MTEHTIPDASTLTGWRKSSHSSTNPDSCVEVLDDHPSGIPVRDSKNPHGPALLISRPGWASFIASLTPAATARPDCPPDR
ncbi:hypothetical protein SGFS_074370 [Streptomyces graminofaciens]|uniref:DUF397 domain-containing protein n=1 Tax=Streptomyces graminofaciens TaxID=68212 RepID=A0ABN5VRL3_9ACTN|nr:DUF397 domain-containing protein [Streptomyces graminofaciens]BBC36143.1 hypothetical protein SGFS_074370 [Streptomyces graminofaciens]